MRFKNFSIWRRRLPHWRADDVVYYATFRHRRELTQSECRLLFQALSRADGRRLSLAILCVLPEQTEAIFSVLPSASGGCYELSKVLDEAKRRAGKAIIAKTGERFPPFWEESLDRIIRDETELEERFEQILQSPCESGLCDEPDDYPHLFVSGKPDTVL